MNKNEMLELLKNMISEVKSEILEKEELLDSFISFE